MPWQDEGDERTKTVKIKCPSGGGGTKGRKYAKLNAPGTKWIRGTKIDCKTKCPGYQMDLILGQGDENRLQEYNF